MPVQRGWNVVKQALDKVYNSTTGFVYEEPLKSIMPDADERAKRLHFLQSECGLEYRITGPQPANEVAIWEVSLMFVEYVAGMLADKAGKDCHNPTHTKLCEKSRDFHHEMLRKYVDDLERLTNEIHLLVPLRPGVDRIPASWELPK
jgi:hypothetical protein